MKILLGVAVILAIPLVVAVFVRKEFAVEREIAINTPKQKVFDYLKYLKNHHNFSKWSSIDPKMKKDFRGTDGTVGFVSIWQSDNKEVGKGEQEIKKIAEAERIDFEIRFTEPFQSTDPAYMTTETVAENQTKVKWGYKGRMNYPTNLMTWLVKGKIEKDVDTGLANLKAILERL